MQGLIDHLYPVTLQEKRESCNRLSKIITLLAGPM